MPSPSTTAASSFLLPLGLSCGNSSPKVLAAGIFPLKTGAEISLIRFRSKRPRAKSAFVAGFLSLIASKVNLKENVTALGRILTSLGQLGKNASNYRPGVVAGVGGGALNTTRRGAGLRAAQTISLDSRQEEEKEKRTSGL